MIAGAGIRLHKVGVIVNALPTSTVHPGCTVELGSNNTALVIVRPLLPHQFGMPNSGIDLR